MIGQSIQELIQYGIEKELITSEDGSLAAFCVGNACPAGGAAHH